MYHYPTTTLKTNSNKNFNNLSSNFHQCNTTNSIPDIKISSNNNSHSTYSSSTSNNIYQHNNSTKIFWITKDREICIRISRFNKINQLNIISKLCTINKCHNNFNSNKCNSCISNSLSITIIHQNLQKHPESSSHIISKV